MSTARLRFGKFTWDPTQAELRHQGSLIELEPEAAELLTLLIRHAGMRVSFDEFKEAIWPDASQQTFEVELARHVRRIRAILNDTGRTPRCIQALPRGYRFVAPVFQDDGRPPLPPRRRRFRLGQTSMLALGVGVVVATAVISLPDPPPASAPPPADPRAGAALEEARALLLGSTREADAVAALALLDTALAAAPDFAPAHALRAATRLDLSSGVDSLAEMARAAAEQALELDPDSPLALAQVGLLRLLQDRDPLGADRAVQAAVRGGSEDPFVRRSVAAWHAARGRQADAVASLEEALTAAPGSPRLTRELGRAHYMARDWQEAARLCAEAARLDESDEQAWMCAAEAREAAGDPDGAWEAARSVLELRELPAEELDTVAARAPSQALRTFRERLAADPSRLRYDAARAAAALGRRAAALEALRASVERGEHRAVQAGYDPAFDALREDEEFVRILRRLTASPADEGS